MNISLREITPANYKECVDLKVADDQAKFVATNVASIAQSKILFPQANTMAVYAGEEMVGFVMFGFDVEENHYYLGRLMIDEKFQGRGYGKAATLAVIEELRKIKDCKDIYLSFVPENADAERLYKSVGFERTGKLNGSEIVMRFVIENKANLKSEI